jgi:hypothetical protein
MARRVSAARGVAQQNTYDVVWLVDPLTRTLEVFWLDGPTNRLTGTHRDEAIVTAPPFEAFGLELAAPWAT